VTPRKAEREQQQARAWDMHLDCFTQRDIADTIGVTRQVVSHWLDKKSAFADFLSPPESRQHFDLWQFPTADKDSGAQSYFGASKARCPKLRKVAEFP
jgi:hypothetical protein